MMKPILSQLYEQDYEEWLRQTSQQLENRDIDQLDWQHLIEELEGLTKSDKRAIASQLIRLLLHLLKWQYQPQRRSDSWLDSITDARTQIELAIEDRPSLKAYPQERLIFCYQKARRQAAQQTQLPLKTFPENCPYSLALILTDHWLP